MINFEHIEKVMGGFLLKLAAVLSVVVLPLSTTFAQTITMEAPQTVSVDEYFKVRYSVNTDEVERFSAPNFSDFEKLSGPNTSTSSSFQMINGHTSHSSSVTYTFVLAPTKAGTFNLPGASVVIKGRTIRCEGKRIKVLQSSTSSGGSANSSSAPDRSRMQAAGSRISDKDLYISVTPSKQKVYKQEAFLLTYRVYSKLGVGLSNIALTSKPDFKGMVSHEIPIKNFSTEVQHINGTAYRVGTIMQYLVFPQQVGRLRIPSVTFDCSVAQQIPGLSDIDAFFNSGATIGVVTKRSVDEAFVEVEKLPEPIPSDYSGAVGKFQVSGKLLTPSPKTGELLNYRIKVSGTGNLKLLTLPKIVFPKSFEVYSPQTTDSVTISKEGATGSIVYDYTLIPISVGKNTLPEYKFTYFDPELAQYVSLTAPSVSFDVARGERSLSDAQKEMMLKNGTIRERKGVLQSPNRGGYSLPTDSLWFWLVLELLVLFSLPLLYYSLRPVYSRLTDEEVRLSGKAARKAAKSIKQATIEHKGSSLSEKIGDIVLIYLSQRLKVPELHTSGEAMAAMKDAGVQDELSQQLFEILEHGEYARFAPISDDNENSDISEKALKAIETMEQNLKKNKKSSQLTAKTIKLIILFLLPCLNVTQALCTTTVHPDSLYNQGKYQEAAKVYEQWIEQKQDADYYYSLGNAYYKLHDLPRSILNYERALLIEPGNNDVRYNLMHCQSKLETSIHKSDEFFFVSASRDLLNSFSSYVWARFGFVLLVICLLSYLIKLLSKGNLLRSLLKWCSLILALLCLLANIFAVIQYLRYSNDNRGVVLQNTPIYKSPSSTATKVANLPAGITVETFEHNDKWLYIELPDERKGWVKMDFIELIRQ